jgi:glycosyltransferase involved in cell wall biosynthesis
MADDPTITSGYSTLGRAMIRALRVLGHDVSYISLQHFGSPVLYPTPAEGTILVYSGDNDLSRKRSVEMIDPDVIIHIRDLFAHTTQFFNAPYSLQQFRKSGRLVIGYVMVQSDPMPFETADAANANFDRVAVSTEWSKKKLVQIGVPWDKIHVIKPGMDQVEGGGGRGKEYFGLDPGKKTVLSIGVHDQMRKNWAGVLKAFSLLKKKDSELFLHTGNGAFYLENFIRHLDLRGRVVMPQQIIRTWGMDEVNDLYGISDCYLSMSTAEGINLPLLESLFHGLPVVCTAHPNHMELLGDIGIYVKTRKVLPSSWCFEYLPEPEDAAQKIDAVLDWGDKERKEFREKAKEYVMDNFSTESVADSVEKLIS